MVGPPDWFEIRVPRAGLADGTYEIDGIVAAQAGDAVRVLRIAEIADDAEHLYLRCEPWSPKERDCARDGHEWATLLQDFSTPLGQDRKREWREVGKHCSCCGAFEEPRGVREKDGTRIAVRGGWHQWWWVTDDGTRTHWVEVIPADGGPSHWEQPQGG